jgi:hypothetical protein
MESFEVGDLVRDTLNEGVNTYGLGVVVATDSTNLLGQDANTSLHTRDIDIPGMRYDVYFNKFERTITFHGDYLEKV